MKARTVDEAVALLAAERNRALAFVREHPFTTGLSIVIAVNLRTSAAVVMARFMEYALALIETGDRQAALQARDAITHRVNALASGIGSADPDQETSGTGEQENHA